MMILAVSILVLCLVVSTRSQYLIGIGHDRPWNTYNFVHLGKTGNLMKKITPSIPFDEEVEFETAVKVTDKLCRYLVSFPGNESTKSTTIYSFSCDDFSFVLRIIIPTVARFLVYDNHLQKAYAYDYPKQSLISFDIPEPLEPWPQIETILPTFGEDCRFVDPHFDNKYITSYKGQYFFMCDDPTYGEVTTFVVDLVEKKVANIGPLGEIMIHNNFLNETEVLGTHPTSLIMRYDIGKENDTLKYKFGFDFNCTWQQDCCIVSTVMDRTDSANPKLLVSQALRYSHREGNSGQFRIFDPQSRTFSGEAKYEDFYVTNLVFVDQGDSGK